MQGKHYQGIPQGLTAGSRFFALVLALDPAVKPREFKTVNVLISIIRMSRRTWKRDDVSHIIHPRDITDQPL
jgi:hypothetical protein